MKIWIHLNGIQQGPYEFEQLAQLGIDEQTPVWYEGLPQWTPAGVAPATAPLFNNDPTEDQPQQAIPQPQIQPQQSQQSANTQSQPKPPTYIPWSIVLTILCCSPFATAALVTGAISASHYNAGNYKGAKQMSDITSWLLIISIALGIITIPFGIISWFL